MRSRMMPSLNERGTDGTELGDRSNGNLSSLSTCSMLCIDWPNVKVL